MNSDIKQIFDMILSFHNVADNSELLSVILTKMMEITNSDAGTLYRVKDGKLHFSIIRNISLGTFQEGDIDLPPIEIDESNIDNVSSYVAIKNEIVVIDDVYKDEKFCFEGPKRYDELTGYKTKSMLAVPLVTEWVRPPDVVGVIQLINAKDPKTGEIVSYGNIYDPPIVPSISKIAANTLANQLYLNETIELFKSIVAVVTQAMDERSAYNNIHTQNVARYVTDFAIYLTERFPEDHKLNFNDTRLEQITMAALLHDIGKLVTPLTIMDKETRLGENLNELLYKFDIKFLQLENEHLRGKLDEKEYDRQVSIHKNALKTIQFLNKVQFLGADDIDKVEILRDLKFIGRDGKPESLLTKYDMDALRIHRGTLTEAERRIMQDHALHTARLLEKITVWKYFSDVPKWAKDHHEFLDGSGYPRNLEGDDIALETRVITIADIFDALTAADRPYKKAVSIEKAIVILRDMAKEGKLDSELVELFVESQIWLKSGHGVFLSA